jgi:hypothetical protein
MRADLLGRLSARCWLSSPLDARQVQGRRLHGAQMYGRRIRDIDIRIHGPLRSGRRGVAVRRTRGRGSHGCGRGGSRG